jgi:hypothetical protein
MPEPMFIKFGVNIMTPEPISMAQFINPSNQSVCLYVYTPLLLVFRPSVARRLRRSDAKMIDELWIGKDFEEIDCDLIAALNRNFPDGIAENHVTPQSE